MSAPARTEAEQEVLDAIWQAMSDAADSDGCAPHRFVDALAKYGMCVAPISTRDAALEEAAKVAEATAVFEDKHDRYEAYRAAHDIVQSIRAMQQESFAAGRDGCGSEQSERVATPISDLQEKLEDEQ